MRSEPALENLENMRNISAGEEDRLMMVSGAVRVYGLSQEVQANRLNKYRGTREAVTHT